MKRALASGLVLLWLAVTLAAQATRQRTGGVIVSTTEGLFFAQRRLISDHALQSRLPVVWAAPGDYAEALRLAIPPSLLARADRIIQ